MRFSTRFFKMALVASVVALVAGCQKKVEKPIDYSSIQYKYLRPASFKADSSKNAEIPSLERRYDYRYAIMLGDTLGVTVLEFESDVYALDYYMNSGHFQGSIPILRGNFLEQSFAPTSASLSLGTTATAVTSALTWKIMCAISRATMADSRRPS